MPMMVGIAGGSGSGKTFLAKKLSEVFAESAVIEIDSYYRDLSELHPQQRSCVNFDVPDAIDSGFLLEHLKVAVSGTGFDVPIYDFSTHTRLTKTRRVRSGLRLVVVEGLFTLYWSELRELLDLKIYVDLDERTRLERRVKRDVLERDRTKSSVEDAFNMTVKPMHEKYVEPTRRFADITISGSSGYEGEVDTLLGRIYPNYRAIGRDE